MIEADLHLDLGALKLDVAFENGAGVTALFGQSGSGKSVTLSLVAGLLKPDRGYVRLNGETLVDTARGVCLPMHRRRIGLVFQDANLFPHLSVRRNLLYGRWFAPSRERRIDFDAVVETLGVGALLSRPPAGLSGGEKQRVAIGRALLSCPRLLLFDEPLAALDMQRKLEIMPLIERIRDEFNIPMIYVSHAIEEVVRLASRVVVLESGQVTAVGDPAQVFGAAAGALSADRFDRSSVLSAQVIAGDPLLGLTELRHPAGRIWIAGAAGPVGGTARVIVRATDVVLSPAPPQKLSVRSVLSGVVRSITPQGPLALVDLDLDHDGGRLAAAVTRGALEELDIRPGAHVYALFKTSALDERALGTAPAHK